MWEFRENICLQQNIPRIPGKFLSFYLEVIKLEKFPAILRHTDSVE